MSRGGIDNIVRAGEYRQLITIEQKTGAISTDPNDAGALSGTTAPFCRAYAKISSTLGREHQLGAQVVGAADTVIEMRYTPGITPLMKVLYAHADGNTRTLDVNMVLDPDERHKKLYLFCTEGTTT